MSETKTPDEVVQEMAQESPPAPPTPPQPETASIQKSAVLSNIASFLDITSQLAPSLKITEVYLPIARMRAHVSSLIVGDDLSLRTTLTSPVGYDREIVKLIHSRSEIVGDDRNFKMEYTKFCREIGNIDKVCLIWALYKSTYGVLANDRKIKCPDPDCKEEWKENITMDELVHDDTFAPWEEQTPFYQYYYPIRVEYDDLVYEFLTKLPSIYDNNLLLSTLSTDVLQANLEKIGSVFTRPQQMAMMTQAVRLSSKSSRFEPVETDQLDQMLISFSSHTPYAVSEEFFDKYGERFDKYVPNFYKKCQCPKCAKQFNLNIDIEVEFFRRSLFGRQESE